MLRLLDVHGLNALTSKVHSIYVYNIFRSQCRFKYASHPSGAFHKFFPGRGTDFWTGALSQIITISDIQFGQRQDAEAERTMSRNFHETFGPKRPASGLFQNPVTRRDLTTPCEDDNPRPMRVNDAPEGLVIVKTSNGSGPLPANNILQRQK